MGFLCGLAGGMLLTPVRRRLVNRTLQVGAAIAAFGLVATAWVAAFQT
jgi:hypothetical protein